MSRFWVAFSLVCGVLFGASVVQAKVANTLHNLSATGLGNIKKPGVGGVCIFCHTPHRASTVRALWNRNFPPITYKLYTSSTLEATLQQPTGASRLCLSCHDGTTAPGNLRVLPATGPVTLSPLTGRVSLGTDLSDDHPVSFVYNVELSLKQGHLTDPAAIPPALPLDHTQQMQCTTCHDPHDERYRKFLRMNDQNSALCTACHRQRNWTDSTHATSTATWNGAGNNPWPHTPYTTVAENGCENCHWPHAALRPPHLLSSTQERDVCLVCHDGSVAFQNLESEFAKPSLHPIASTNWTHEPREDPNLMPRHVTCVDCHNPHQTVSASASPPEASGPLRGVQGVNLSGVSVNEATDEYEVCLKCHGIQDQTTVGRIVRQDNIRNVRLEIAPSNPSYHPLAAVGQNGTMGGFESGYSTASLIYCTDCHNNDEWTPTGSQPRGPHGSLYTPLLEREYQMNDPMSEAFQTYALCYKCHNRDFLINDRANTFPHNEHLQNEQQQNNAPCAVCHDAHGSRQTTGLINFMRQDPTGQTVVRPSRRRRRLEHISLGPGRGQCYLLCHGTNHEPETYP